MFIHLTLVPYIGHAGELKTKPTQHSVNELRRIGIQPDMLLCRSEAELSRRHPQEDRAVRVAAGRGRRLGARTSTTSTRCRSGTASEGVDDFICDHFGLEAPAGGPHRVGGRSSSAPTQRRRAGADRARRQVRRSSRTPTSRSPRRCATPASRTAARSRSTGSTPRRSTATSARCELLGGADGILVPGGFGGRGIEGKIRAVRVARERRIPYLGICLGMQIAVCEFARHVAGMAGANSTEFDIETEWPVIDLLPEQKEVSDLGGTMRLGADPIKLHDGHAGARALRRGRHLRAPPPPLRGVDQPAQAARGRRPRRLRHVAGRAPGRDHRAAATSTRSSSPRSTTPSSSRAPSARRRCSASSSRAAHAARRRGAEAARPTAARSRPAAARA